MPKLGVFSGEEICPILETEGFLRVRQKGSHTILQKTDRTDHDHRPRSDAPNDSNRYSSVDHSPTSSTSRALPCVGCTERSARTSSHCRFAGEGVAPFRPAPSVSELQPPLRSPHSAKAPSVRKKELLFCHVFWRNDAMVEVFGGRQNRRHIGALKPV